MSVTITTDLRLCKKCMQMKNHKIEQHFYPEKKEIITCMKCNTSETHSKTDNLINQKGCGKELYSNGIGIGYCDNYSQCDECSETHSKENKEDKRE